MRTIFLLLLLCFTLPSFTIINDNDLEMEKYQNYLAAISNSSTFQYFTVIRVKNLNSGEVKEICNQGNFLLGALHTELNANYEEKGQKKVFQFANGKLDRYFEFKRKKALENISFDDYRADLLDSTSRKYDMAEIVGSIQQEKKFQMRIYSEDEMIALAHVLFNKGIMTGESSCFGGTLYFIDRKHDLR